MLVVLGFFIDQIRDRLSEVGVVKALADTTQRTVIASAESDTTPRETLG
jgi:hypothetical protein